MTATLDFAAFLLAPGNPIYADKQLIDVLGFGDSIFKNYDFSRVFASLVSLERVIGEPIGSNRALWSLGIEWFFYFLFPAALFLFARFASFGRHSALIAAAATAVVLASLGQRGLAGYWIIWSAGAFLSQVRLTGRLSWLVPWIGGAAAILMLLAVPATHFKEADLLIGFGFAALLMNQNVLNRRLNRSFDKALANCSYSLYVTHMPVLVFTVFLFFEAGLIGVDGYLLSWTGLGLFFVAIAIQLTVALLFGHFFERRTDDLKRGLSQRLLAWRTMREQSRPA